MRSHYSAGWTLALVLLVSSLLAVSAANNRGQPAKPTAADQQANRLHAPTANTKKVSDSVTNLAAKIANALSNQKSKTEIFSPVSIAGALSLLLLGSGGQTQQELLAVMGLNTGQLSFQDIHLSFGRLFQDLVSNDPSLEPLVTWRLNDKCNRYNEDEEDEEDDFINSQSPSNEYPRQQISIANGVFLQRGLKPGVRFHNVTQRVYQGTVENLDFEREPNRAAAHINDWCSRATNGKIREIVTQDILYNSRMIVANALYFKAQWETTFSPYGTRPRSFFLNGQQEPAVSVETMATSGCFPYYNATAEYGVRIIGLPYEMGKSTMYIILPNGSNRQVLREKMATLGAPQLNWMIDQMVVRKVMVVLPKLNISNRILLSSVLERAGIRDLFNPSRSNLSKIFADDQPGASSPVTGNADRAPVTTPTQFATGGAAQVRPSALKTTTPPVRQNTVPSTVQTTQPARPQTNFNQANQITISTTPAQDCRLIEHCQPMPGDLCSCNRIPTNDDNTGCGAHLLAHYYEKTIKDCKYSFGSSPVHTHICIKPSYRFQPEYSSGDICEQQSGCKMFQKLCYCCTAKEQNAQPSTQYRTTTSRPRQSIGSRFEGDESITYNTTPFPTRPFYSTEPSNLVCEPVPRYDRNTCTFKSHYQWNAVYNSCIDPRRCWFVHVQKRQAPEYYSPSQQYQTAPSRAQPQQTLLLQPELHQLRPQEQRPNPQNTQLRISEQATPYQTKQETLDYHTRLQQQQPQQNQLQQQQQQRTELQRQSPPSVYVNEIVTHVTLDVNEQGTEGGAVTAALIDRIGSGYSFLVDSPFLILIRHDRTQLPLFYGAVYDPRQ
uniref:Serpin domain-containing protein n=1 Tax=Anopheles arabiensis TaxID=7173 RepID=A0A2C9GJU8_ANOAR